MRDPKIPAGIYRQLMIRTGRWGGTRSSQGSLLIKVHNSEHPHPMFWCIQSELDFNSVKRLSNFGRPVYALSSTGGLTENTCDIVKAIAAHYVTEIRKIQPFSPYFLAGYCAGADMIYEVARQLATSSGNYVERLILVEPIPTFEVQGRLNALAAYFFLMFGSLAHHLKTIGNLSIRQRLVYISSRLFRFTSKCVNVLSTTSSITLDNSRDSGSLILSRKRYYTFAPAPQPGNMILFRGRASEYASQTGYYTYAPYPGRVILIYGSASEFAFQRTGIFRSYFQSYWEKLALDGFEVHIVPGRHTFFDTNEGCRALSKKLRDVLKNCQESGV